MVQAVETELTDECSIEQRQDVLDFWKSTVKTIDKSLIESKKMNVQLKSKDIETSQNTSAVVRSSPQKKEVARHTVGAPGEVGSSKLEGSPGEMDDPMMGLESGNLSSEKIEKVQSSID